MPQLLAVRNRWCDLAAVSDNDSEFDDADHNIGEQALDEHLRRPDDAGSGISGKSGEIRPLDNIDVIDQS